MPRLQGEHLNSSNFSIEEKFTVAELIAEALSQFHSWKVTDFGDLNTDTFSINPFEESYKQWLFNRIIFWLEDAKKYSEITAKDINWVEDLLNQSKDAFENFHAPTFVMGDFKPGNFLIHVQEGNVKIGGVFDFTNAYFADPISDLIKMVTYYIDANESNLAKRLIEVYFGKLGEEMGTVIKCMKVHMLHQRVLDWGCAKAIKIVTWEDNLPFYKWVESYTDSVESLFE